MAFGKGKQKEKETKKPTTLAEYKAQGWEVGPYSWNVKSTCLYFNKRW